MASNSVFTAEKTEIGEIESFSVRRTGWDTWDASLPWESLADCIQVLTQAYAMPPGSIARGTVYQVQNIYDNYRPQSILQWLDTQDRTYVLSLYYDELPTLTSVLADLADDNDEALDLDLSKLTRIKPGNRFDLQLAQAVKNEDTELSKAVQEIGAEAGAEAAPVQSVNGLEGDVTLDADSVGAAPASVVADVTDLENLTNSGRLSEDGVKSTIKLSTFATDTDYSSLEDALAAIPLGGVLEIRNLHTRAATWTINKPCTIRFAQGGQITVSSATVKAITVAADNVTLERPLLRGTGAASSTGAGIQARGVSATAPIDGLKVDRPDIQNFTQYGILLEWVTNFEITGGFIRDIAYGGVMVLSGINGVIRDLHVKDINKTAGLANSYGIAVSRAETTTSLVTYPRSTDILIDGCLAENVPWEGLDTHAGLRIKFTNNTVTGCRVGIAAVGSSGVYGPKEVVIRGNVLDSQNTTGAAGSGVVVVGAGDTLGSPIELATGVVEGNVISRHGTDSSGTAAILAYVTNGLVVSGNTMIEPVSNGVTLFYDNYGFTVIGNTVIDVWSESVTQAAAYRLRSNYNTGVFSNNTLAAAGKTATHVNEFGLYIQGTDATTSVQLGSINLAAATSSQIVDTGRRANSFLNGSEVTVGRSGGRVSFFGGTSIVKPTGTPAAATDLATTQTLVNDLRTKLISLGLIS